jgi:hypothetical protein
VSTSPTSFSMDDVKNGCAQNSQSRARSRTSTGNKHRTSAETTTSVRMVVGSWTIQIVLLSLLDPTGVVIYLGWTPGNGTNV